MKRPGGPTYEPKDQMDTTRGALEQPSDPPKMKAARTGASTPAGPNRSLSCEGRPAVQDATCPQSAKGMPRPLIDVDDGKSTTTVYGDILGTAQRAVRETAHRAAEIGAVHTEAAEALESVRLVLHRLVDIAVDDEALCWPDPQRLIARTPAYVELVQERVA